MRYAILAGVLFLPAAAAFPIPKGAEASTLAGSTWEGTNVWSQGQRESLKLTFREKGQLTYDPGNSALHYRGTWEQAGNTISWTVNEHAFFKGTITGDQLEGTGSNKDGNNAVVKFTRQETK